MGNRFLPVNIIRNDDEIQKLRAEEASQRAQASKFRNNLHAPLTELIQPEQMNLQAEGAKIFVRDEPATFIAKNFSGDTYRNPILDVLPAIKYHDIYGNEISKEAKMTELETFWDADPTMFWVSDSNNPNLQLDEEEAVCLALVDAFPHEEIYFMLLEGQTYCLGKVVDVDHLLGFSLV